MRILLAVALLAVLGCGGGEAERALCPSLPTGAFDAGECTTPDGRPGRCLFAEPGTWRCRPHCRFDVECRPNEACAEMVPVAPSVCWSGLPE